MTYEEAKKLKIEIHKDAIKDRLYRIDPVKYKRFKRSKPVCHSATDELLQIWDMVSIIHKHEHGDPFESKGFYDILKRKKML